MSDEWDRITIVDGLASTIGGVWGDLPEISEVNVHVYRSTDFNADGRLSVERGAERSIKKSQLASRELVPGDILLEKSGGGPKQPVGRVVYVDDAIPKESVCANFIQLVRADPALFDSKYLFYVMWHAHQQNLTLEYQAQTTGIRNLRTVDYLSREVPLPPLRVQRRIVDLLEHLDTHLANLQTERDALATYRDLVRQSLDTSREAVTLADLAEVKGIQIGPFGSQLHASEYTEAGIPVVMPQDIVDGEIRTEKIKRVSPETALGLKRHFLREGDVVFPRRGDLGKRALVNSDQAGWLCGTGCLRFRPSDGESSALLFEALANQGRTDWLIEHAVGTTMLNLNTSILAGLPVAELTNEMRPRAAVSAEASLMIRELKSERASLDELRAAILSALLTREVEIPDSYEELLGLEVAS